MIIAPTPTTYPQNMSSVSISICPRHRHLFLSLPIPSHLFPSLSVNPYPSQSLIIETLRPITIGSSAVLCYARIHLFLLSVPRFRPSIGYCISWGEIDNVSPCWDSL
ncbi:hypothetical protein ACMFMG_007994 [Clarireedia jacksonii]